MNVREGASRMKRAGSWMAIIPVTMGVLIVGINLVAGLGHGILLPQIPLISMLAIELAIPGTLLWIAGWITEGFAEEPN
jgi:hypothetical protein